MKVDQNNKLQYPVVENKKSFVTKMKETMQYQEANPTQVQKSAFYQEECPGQQIYKINLRDQIFRTCNFYTCRIISSIFTDCTFLGCNFSAADILNVKFINCTFRDCNFTDAKMQDVKAQNCGKTNCIFTNVDFSKNVEGFSQDDSKVIQDSVEDHGVTENISVYEIVKSVLIQDGWEQEQKQSFQLTSVDDSNCGLAIYPNPQKNSSPQEQYWQFVVFYGNQSLLMNDFNLYGTTEKTFKDLVSTWKNKDLISQAQGIIRNLLQILQDKEK